MTEDEVRMHKVFNSLYRANHLAKKRLRLYTLNDLETYILIDIAFMEEVTQKSLCNRLRAPKTTINNSIMNLKEKKLVELIPSKDDKRKKILVLTEEGKAKKEKILLALDESNQRIFDYMGYDNVEALRRSLSLFIEAISKEIILMKN